MNDIKKIQFDLLMVLLENDIIDDTHSISEREQVNTLEDVANEMIIEYNSLVNDAKTRKEKALNLDIVIVSVCENCGEPKESHSKTSLLCNGQFSHFKQTEL
jgi:hypothetical protein